MLLCMPVILPTVLIIKAHKRVKDTRDYRERERGRYGRLVIVHTTETTPEGRSVRSSDTGPEQQVQLQSGISQLFNELPLEIFLMIFKDFSCKELGYVSV